VWCILVILALGRQRQENLEFKAGLGCTVKSYLNKTKKNKEEEEKEERRKERREKREEKRREEKRREEKRREEKRREEKRRDEKRKGNPKCHQEPFLPCLPHTPCPTTATYFIIK
jgi:hypothetical protein